jgi:D-alanyl-D-alanine carboxypeptidase/D-alanyl-D-alanine-endopeptidase (penicillin-binding protein 4)
MLGLIILGLIGAAPAQAATQQTRALRSLKATLRRDLRQAGGHDGALVIDQTTGRTLFASAANVRRLPASVQKLYTTTTALLTLGPRARLHTQVLGVGSLDSGGVWDGTLYLRGGGDPTFGDAGFDQAAYGTGATVQALVSRLAAAGITSVNGRIDGDESYFDALRGTPATGYAPSLELEGELSGLAYDAGFTSAGETALQTHPARFAAQRFAAALRSGGIKVPSSTPIHAAFAPAAATPLASVSSPPLSTLIRLTNAPSDNFFAETLLKDLGARFGAGGTTAAGAAVVRSVIAREFGLHPRFNDGSGLSRADATSPSQVVSLLRRMQGNRAFVSSLAVAGRTGTMKDEMTGTRAAGNCRGKTGTLHDVANLVGYCRARNGDRLVFAFLFNAQSNAYAGHAIEDRMGVALANYNP